MRDEWKSGVLSIGGASYGNSNLGPRSSQGLTRVGRLQGELPSLTMASKAMRLKSRGASADVFKMRSREVSERRQVGDAESLVNPPVSSDGSGKAPWWRNVGMEEGL